MGRTFSVKSPFQMVTWVTITFMLLNAFLPLNLSSVEAEATEYPFKLIITLEKTTYKLTELVNATWTLMNIGEENVTLYHSADTLFDFVVYDEDFIHVFRYRSEWGIPMVYHPFAPIPPGHRITLTGFWDQIYDGSGNVKQELWHKEVPPGTYYVSGIFSSATYNVKLRTPAIRITVGG